MIKSSNISKMIVKAQQRLARQAEFDMLEYLKKAQDGDKKAKELVVCKNLKLVLNVVYKFSENNTLTYDDIFSIGLIGLVKAVDSFDCTSAYKFSTFAYHCIYNEIGMAFRKNRAAITQTAYLDDIISGTENSQNPLNIERTLHDPKQTQNLLDCENKLLVEQILDYAIKHKLLNETESDVIKSIYDFENNKIHSIVEVAQKLNLSKTHVSRVHTNAIIKLKNIASALYARDMRIK